MSAMSISQLARNAGVGVETVRYYQRRGLLPDPQPQKTGASGIRHYGPDEARRLRGPDEAEPAPLVGPVMADARRAGLLRAGIGQQSAPLVVAHGFDPDPGAAGELGNAHRGHA